MSEDSKIKSPTDMDFLTKMARKFEAMTPEEKEVSDSAIAEQRRKADAVNHAIHVEQLRSNWDAPKRHLTLENPKRDGEWGKKLELLEAKIGKGFTVALVGVRGNGKTQLGVQLMLVATEQLRPSKFCTAAKFFMAIKASYRHESCETEAQVLQRYRKPVLLVIDEVGKRSDSEWENSQLFELLNDRYNDLTDTVLIDNRKKSDFVTAIGPSLASRIAESGGIIECDWEGFR